MQTSRRPSKSRFHYQHIMCVPVRQVYTVISVVRCSIGRVGGRHRVTTAGLRKAHNLLRGLSHRECLVLSADIAPMWPACSLHHNITNPYQLGNEFLCKKNCTLVLKLNYWVHGVLILENKLLGRPFSLQEEEIVTNPDCVICVFRIFDRFLQGPFF